MMTSKLVLIALLIVCVAVFQPTAASLYHSYGWKMLLRVTAGYRVSPFYLFYTKGVMNPNELDLMTTADEPAGAYKSGLIDSWTCDGFDQVKVSFYTNLEEVAYVVFNTTGRCKEHWFHRRLILHSGYSDIKSGPHNIFSIEGEQQRRFYMNRNHGGCSQDRSWMIVEDLADDVRRSHGCSYDVTDSSQFPQFLYSVARDPTHNRKIAGHPSKSSEFKKAKVMVIYGRR